MKLKSAAPVVRLVHAFSTPYDNAVATARTCYSSRIISDDDVREKPALRDRIAKSIYLAGHHTTLQHAHFQFTFENVSRQALWSFFHAHPFYNSEQVSQRYVEVKPGRVLVPDLGDDKLQSVFEACVERQMATYQKLNALLEPAAKDAYFTVYPARRKRADEKRWQNAIKKRCQEVARYVLPVGTHAHLYHTVSGLTLHRYHRLASMLDCPTEQRMIIDAMCAAVNEIDPQFFEALEDSLPLESTFEARLFDAVGRDAHDVETTRAFRDEFDASLEGLTSKMVSAPDDAVTVVAGALRDAIGLPKARLSDDDALGLLLNPQQSAYLGEALNLNTLSKAMRALELVHFTFKKKISHTADSQAQRHRMTPGVRPALALHIVPGEPDYITPMLFDHALAEEARAVYVDEMRAAWDDIKTLADGGVPAEAWQYLLPNAVSVRFTETGSLMHQHHKWTTRLCFNAQEEIWHAVLDEVQQVKARAPALGRWLLPPCGLRKHAGSSPICPEGDRFCGVPVWKQEHESYTRLL